MKAFLLLFLTAFAVVPSVVESKLACSRSEFCEEQLRPGSKCVDGFCSNPFVEGCFKTLLGDKPLEELQEKYAPAILDAMNGRVCNSDDLKQKALMVNNIDDKEDEIYVNGNNDAPFCLDNEFDYFEIRIHNSNWESPIFLAWIMQIMLMEVLKVPAAIGLNSGVTNITSFYSPVNTLEYSSVAYPFDALKTNVPCEETQEDCVDVLTEVWNGQFPAVTKALQEGTIDALDWCGQVGKLGFYIPTSTAQKDPTLLSHYGLQGESNRAKLAETFQRPTTWAEYCEQVSETNCTQPDDYAESYPPEGSEAKYFSSGSYSGYFRMLPENNCTEFPDTCTGYMVAPPCSWSTNVDAQLYWNDIVGIALDGPEEPNGGYSYGEMIEIWNAANATTSDIMMWWWRPDAMLSKYSGSDWSFQEILLPTVTDVCFKNRIPPEDRCSTDISVRRGDPLGACDHEAHALLKIMSATMTTRTSSVEEVRRSPGYPFVRALKVNDLEVQSMLNQWIEPGIDQYGNDAREAVCAWVVENVDTLLDFIPQGHPRTLDLRGSYQHGYVYVAMAVSIFALVGLLIVFAFVHKYRWVKVFVYAQEIFVKIILFGFLLVLVGGSLYAVEPTNGTCIARSWLTNVGFSTVLSAVLVKMSTINRIMQKSKKCKRVKVPREAMFGAVTVLVLIDAIILIVWTSLSPPQAIEELVLPEELGTTVESSVICDSQMIVFNYVLDGWHLLLLIVASVLSFQSRDIVPAFNESRSIGTMIYSNFLFMLIRLIVFVLGDRGLISSNVYGASMSLLYSLDTMIAMTIYVIPKIFEAKKDPYPHVSRGSILISGASLSGMSGQFQSGAISSAGGSANFSTSSINNSSDREQNPSDK